MNSTISYCNTTATVKTKWRHETQDGKVQTISGTLYGLGHLSPRQREVLWRHVRNTDLPGVKSLDLTAFPPTREYGTDTPGGASIASRVFASAEVDRISLEDANQTVAGTVAGTVA